MLLARPQTLQERDTTGDEQEILGDENIKKQGQRSTRYKAIKKNGVECAYYLAMSDKKY